MEQLTPTEPNRLQLLAVIGEAFAIAGSATSVALAATARTLADHFGDGCGLQLFDAPQPFGGWHHDAELGAHIHAALAAHNRPGFDGLSGRVARTGHGIRIARTTTQELRPFTLPEIGTAFSRCGVHSAMVLPMRVPGRTIGVLTALRDRTPQGYSAAEQEFLQELADYVALAVTTVQLAS
jgi:GAF domain-containing protein